MGHGKAYELLIGYPTEDTISQLKYDRVELATDQTSFLVLSS
jgi:hypothetical protein